MFIIIAFVIILSISLYYIFVHSDKQNMTNIDSPNQVPPKDWQPLRILSANVGNSSLNCQGVYNNKLCEISVEKAISNNIQALKPDIVFLQELLHPSQCSGWTELNHQKVCYLGNLQSESNQARRLLGKEYTIVCAARVRPQIGHPLGMECIGIRISIGTIEGCEPGELCFSSKGLDVPGEECNPEFIVMSAVAKVHNLRIGLINAHPNSRDRLCRDNAIKQIFEGYNSIHLLEFPKNIIIAGDFNFDPFKGNGNTPESWQKYVGVFGSGLPFYYHSGLAEHIPPYATTFFLLQKKTVDHLISNFALGTCITLGESPSTQRIDNGRGMDHRAILCNLWIPPDSNP
jgi:hypothetical protein